MREAQDAFFLHRRLVLAGAVSQTCELDLRRQDGSVLIAALKSRLLAAESSGPVRWLMSLTDITASRQQQKELVRDLSSMPQEHPIPSMRISRSGIVDYANEASAAFLRHWMCRVGERMPAECVELVHAALEGKQVLTREIMAEGSIYQCTLAPFPDRDYVNVYALDITWLETGGGVAQTNSFPVAGNPGIHGRRAFGGGSIEQDHRVQSALCADLAGAREPSGRA